uniref:Elongation factor G, mitochondrial n=1 Tax=Chromera velia CCMP2878 TaxID=1169474 RepID=A0A0G4EZN1_9ALVE|eukprot:Cvel_14350.t1-p1 / transcript=Cvel_14350.t1 / gene=Cvel_14350 / organism=Chromera_velia_CCMP2878 / gene_product=Elongation factor G, putative / transcript_product=Elongation factor G, putative / location=Cvel_scaffold1017:19120-25921(-) / protein_length=769 / sequence_SO=supercontig / SO=protein_coding / is_pseudo=false
MGFCSLGFPRAVLGCRMSASFPVALRRRASPFVFRLPSPFVRGFASAPSSGSKKANEYMVDLDKVRNIGISAHVDSGKTTTTERILFYTGKIKEVHEVGGKDGVGAKMDSMELERERGITIQSAATFTEWEVENKRHNINIIDTPGHVDFQIEVERALRVLDGAVLLMCAVAGVQSQTLTVDRQMRRYQIPRVLFVNKLDRAGADPWRALEMAKKKLGLTIHPIQIPMGLEHLHEGICDVVRRKAYLFEGHKGNQRVEMEVPDKYKEEVAKVRASLLELLADLDDEFAETFLELEDEVSVEAVDAAIRRQTLAHNLVPMLMGSAQKNEGVQNLLDAVCRYLPSPAEVENKALDLAKGEEEEIVLSSNPRDPLVALAFKIQEVPGFGQLTYFRVYQGTMRKGMGLIDMTLNKKVQVKQVLKMHADEARETEAGRAGEIVAVGGIECASGTTFTDGRSNVSLESMFVPEPVVSLSIDVPKNAEVGKFVKAVKRFMREDPTFKYFVDEESKEHIIAGMGELHLGVYVERMKREYGVEAVTGEPKVAFRETITQQVRFDYTHKRQSGGRGQYAKLQGFFEPLPMEEFGQQDGITFSNQIVGNPIPPNYYPSIEKGFKECCTKGHLSGSPVINMKVVVSDGQSHEVDSSDYAFRLCANGAFKNFYLDAMPTILEPIMKVEVMLPTEHKQSGLSTINKRKGMVINITDSGEQSVVEAEVPLKDMFGYISDLRGATQGQGEFSMEFERYQQMGEADIEAVNKKYLEELRKKKAEKN